MILYKNIIAFFEGDWNDTRIDNNWNQSQNSPVCLADYAEHAGCAALQRHRHGRDRPFSGRKRTGRSRKCRQRHHGFSGYFRRPWDGRWNHRFAADRTKKSGLFSTNDANGAGFWRHMRHHRRHFGHLLFARCISSDQRPGQPDALRFDLRQNLSGRSFSDSRLWRRPCNSDRCRRYEKKLLSDADDDCSKSYF